MQGGSVNKNDGVPKRKSALVFVPEMIRATALSRSVVYAACARGELVPGVMVFKVGHRFAAPRIQFEAVLGPTPGDES
jgi:hypothetical protein